MPDVRSHGIANYDFTVFKNTPITERVGLQFRPKSLTCLTVFGSAIREPRWATRSLELLVDSTTILGWCSSLCACCFVVAGFGARRLSKCQATPNETGATSFRIVKGRLAYRLGIGVCVALHPPATRVESAAR